MAHTEGWASVTVLARSWNIIAVLAIYFRREQGHPHVNIAFTINHEVFAQLVLYVHPQLSLYTVRWSVCRALSEKSDLSQKTPEELYRKNRKCWNPT